MSNLTNLERMSEIIDQRDERIAEFKAEIERLRQRLDRYQRMEQEGITEQDIHETMPPKP